MLHEPALRRPGFRPGPQIRLADGQAWTFPAPPEGGPGAFDPEGTATVVAILEAEDEAERLRAELALAIFLLATNYDLAPSDYAALLDYPPGHPALAAVQQASHDLATAYVLAGQPSAEVQPVTRGWSSPIPGREADRDLLIGRVLRGWTWHRANAAALPRLLRSLLSACRSLRSGRATS